jgi:hypothetical protein
MELYILFVICWCTIYSETFEYSMTFDYCVKDRWIYNPLNISTNRKVCYVKHFMICPSFFQHCINDCSTGYHRRINMPMCEANVFSADWLMVYASSALSWKNYSNRRGGGYSNTWRQIKISGGGCVYYWFSFIERKISRGMINISITDEIWNSSVVQLNVSLKDLKIWIHIYPKSQIDHLNEFISK